jgi:hypothetical protein
VILTLRDPARHGCGGGDACLWGGGPVRVPVLACADALKSGGATVDLVTAGSDADIDAAVKPVEAGEARLVVAAATDAEVRAVVRRMVRHLTPPPSKRPADMPSNRTIPDLPPRSVLPRTGRTAVRRARPATAPADVAAATLATRAASTAPQ